MSAAVKLRTRYTLDEALAMMASGEASADEYAWANTVVSLHTAIQAYEDACRESDAENQRLRRQLAALRGGR